MSNWKKLLSVLVAVLMLLTMPITTGIARAVAEGTAEQTETPSEDIAFGTEEMDPNDLHVRKLGDVTEVEEDPDEFDPESLEVIDLNRIVRVSIFLDGKSTIDQGYEMQGIAENSSAKAYRDKLRRQQETMQQKIEQAIGHELNVKWNLTLLVNAISVEIPYKDIVVIQRMDGVKSVEPEIRYEAPNDDLPAEPMTSNTSKYMVGASTAWDAGYTGAGSRVAIIDTGLDTTHVMFSETPFNYAINEAGASSELFTQAQLNALSDQLNTKSNHYISAKVPYAYDYIDKDTDVTHYSDGSDGSNHGSHVAGIAAGNRYTNGTGTKNTSAVGQAPDAQL